MDEFAEITLLLSSASISIFLLEYIDILSLSLSIIDSVKSDIYLERIFSKFSFFNILEIIININLFY